jgi:hypothetical protein
MLLLGLVFGIATAVLAWRKGFNPWLWLLSGGPVALVVCSFLAPARGDGLSAEEAHVRRMRSTRVATGILVVLGLINVLLFAAGVHASNGF